MGKFSDELLFGMTIRESATDGSDFTNPATDYRRLFLGEDGKLHVKDSSGTVTDPYTGSGAVATDSIWDAAGDLVQGTGSNTAARLALGAAGTVPTSTGSTNAYKYPPGYEFDYVQITSNVSQTATSEATANTVVTGNAVTYDGSTVVMVEFWCNHAGAEDGPGVTDLRFWLYDGSSSIGFMGYIQQTGDGANIQYMPVHAMRRITPSNAAHTYSVRVSGSVSGGNVAAGAGGSGNVAPAFIRITKVA